MYIECLENSFVLNHYCRAAVMILSKVTRLALPRLSASLHTSSSVHGSWKIPDRLSGTAEAENPGFFEMVEYYFHKAWCENP